MRDPAADDGILSDWLAHYAAMMLLIVLVVVVASTAWAAFAVPRTEMWSIVVDSAQEVPARQLGVVGEALFQAEDTYAEAMQELGMTGDPEQLYRIVNLRSVPESRLLIVVAKTDDVYSASTASDVMAQALVHAFERSAFPGLRVLGAPQAAPVPTGLSVDAIALMAAAAGIVLAFATAIITYRVRRPVLSLHRAAGIVHPEEIVTAQGTSRALGALRRRVPAIAAGAMRSLTNRVRDTGATLHAPGWSERDRRRLASSLGLPDDLGAGPVIVACDPRTRERDLRTFRGLAAPSVELLWIG